MTTKERLAIVAVIAKADCKGPVKENSPVVISRSPKAGMEAAAGMCQQIADGHTQAAIDSHRADDMLMYEDRGIGASECVVAIYLKASSV